MAAADTTTASSSSRGGQQKVDVTMVELMQHVQKMDCHTAYEQMCRVQDEIKRLQQQLDQLDEAAADGNNNENGNMSVSHIEDEGTPVSQTAAADIEDGPSSQVADNMNVNMKKAHGTWLDNGGKCSIEYLPNIKCYHITLTKQSSRNGSSSADSTNDNNIPMIQKDDLKFTMSKSCRDDCSSSLSSDVSLFEMKLIHSSSTSGDKKSNEDTLLSLVLPAWKTSQHQDIDSSNSSSSSSPTVRISVDNNHSISIRINLQQTISDPSSKKRSSSMDLMDNLLGIEETFFNPSTTSSNDINHLYCRKCRSTPIILNGTTTTNNNANATNNNNTSTTTRIHSVLPLPSGYWDDIEDYLICYDGQPSVDFSTSTMNAIRNVALEDDVVIVLHKDDVNDNDDEDGGSGGGGSGGGKVNTTRDGKGYGEHSATLLRGGNDMMNTSTSNSSQLWKDKSTMKGNRGNIITCSKCYSVLGFVSGHDSNTLRFYKHLLSCGDPFSSSPSSLTVKNSFSKYTCGSFIAREMVRYAESEAIYTFIVGVSDENDWTRLSRPSECLLLHMLSWDSALVGVDGRTRTSGDDREDGTIEFNKVLKVIFDETTDRGQYSSSGRDDEDGTSTKWTWGGIDLCCPPSMSNGLEDSEDFSTEPQTKATSVRIYLSNQEWSELRHVLVNGSEYFSEMVKDAVVLSKLGMPENGNGHSASLSYLPLIS